MSEPPDASLVSLFSVLAPWDILRGRDVFLESSELSLEISIALLTHFAPNCATFSRAREIPIRNVANPPKPLRSEVHPEGIPEELQKLSKKALKRLNDDTSMANLSADYCCDIHLQGRKFTLEHPGRSIALNLSKWKKLQNLPGVRTIFYNTCMFNGSRRKKFQVLITNEPIFEKFIGKLCSGNHICDRTGLKHLKWRPTVSAGKVVQFQTGDEREYPLGFCQEYAKAARQCMRHSGAFLEVFSGPNAPLSYSVGESLGVQVPGRRLETKGIGVKNEVQHLAQLLESGPSAPIHPPEKRRAESTTNRITSVQAGRQPGYGKRTRLIPDGLKDPKLHLEEAVKLEHPFSQEWALKRDHVDAISATSLIPDEDTKKRLKELSIWTNLARSQDVVDKQLQHEMVASGAAVRLGRSPRTALMEKLGEKFGIEDKSVPRLCLTGVPIVGEALRSPFFEEHLIPAQITVEELLSTSQRRRPGTLYRIKKMAESSSAEMNKAIWEKAIKEVRQGSMDGPFNEEQIIAKHGRFFNLVPSFGLAQGTNEKGEPKFRRIDDHSASHNNLAATRTQKIPMAMVDYLLVMITSMANHVSTDLMVGTEDMQGAYRQVPLPDSQLSISITGVYNPDTKEVSLFEMFGQPFGAGHAVPNFYRVAEWLSRVIARGFNIVIDHFFDDFFMVLRRTESHEGSFFVREAFSLLGFKLDPDKTQVPANVAMVLGVAVNTAALSTERLLLVEPKPTRIKNLCEMIDAVLRQGTLTPNMAASLSGKFGFLCSTMFGKVGRCCSAALRARQYGPSEDTSLTPQLITSLNLMRKFAIASPTRKLMLGDSKPPIILYTDASDVPERVSDRWVVGAVMLDVSKDFDMHHTFWSVPQEIIDKWIPKQSYMGQLETLACPLALYTWSSQVHRRRVLLFVDNDSAASCLVRGFSPKQDTCSLVGQFWLAASESEVEVYIDRVESKSNIADGPSRLAFELLHSLSSKFTPPCTSPFFTSDISWFVEPP